ncbi:MAG: glutamate--tRNA ligase [Saprospirales bacterium]|nr:MAG: glutamate--tRNA ligase [Saprospirales bacterium]
MSTTRVRFAPSPTGPLHIGGLRTALYNYLFTKSLGGSFILRIEDTDRNRYVSGAEQYILDALNWSGIKIDEGGKAGGLLGPYKQSERLSTYRVKAEDLVNRGCAYYAFDTEEELEHMRAKRTEAGEHSPRYDYSIREKMHTSLNLSKTEVQEKLAAGNPWVIRFKTPESGTVVFTDLIRGEIRFECNQLDDKVLLKSDGWPTYHLANVVDDQYMQISHVIRGEEWLSSTALHVLLYQAFKWEKDMPQFAHLPLILKPEGKGKLSKRDGARLGMPVFPMEWKEPDTGDLFLGFKEMGFLPEAMINFIALLGWNPGIEQEIFSMEELIGKFSIEKVGKAGARFDFDKAKWFNHQYIQKLSQEELAKEVLSFFEKSDIKTDNIKLIQVCGLMKERIQLLSELPGKSQFFFSDDFKMDTKQLRNRWKEDSEEILTNLLDVLSGLVEFKTEEIESVVKTFISEKGLSFGKVLPLLRLASSGTMEGPDLFPTLEILGSEKVIERITNLIKMDKN